MSFHNVNRTAVARPESAAFGTVLKNFTLLASGMALLGACAFAQETRGTIFGRVTDPQSAVIAGATVVVTNTETNTSAKLTTNQTGYYEASLLLAGSYRVSAEAAGFKRLVRSGITLSVSARAEVNLALQLGAVTESISVTAEAPMLDTSAVTSGRTMDNQELMDLPIFSGTSLLLLKLAPGVQSSGERGAVTANALGRAADSNVAGGIGGHDFSIDGAPNQGARYEPAYLPSADTIQEFRVETSNFDASAGKSTGISVNVMTKAGTNKPHGTLTFQHDRQSWNGTPFFVRQQYYRSIAAAEAAGDPAQADYLRSQPMRPGSGSKSQYAATFGGPVMLPRLYSGKDRLFFFLSFVGYDSAGVGNSNRTVPTMANRQGDFSQLLNVDASRYQIYDPTTVRADAARPTHYIRSPFPGNLIPLTRVANPAYSHYVKFMPQPNNDPVNPSLEPRNNYRAVATPTSANYRTVSNRVDYAHSPMHRFSGRWTWMGYGEERNNWTYETMNGLQDDGLGRHSLSGTVDWVYTVNSRTVLDVVAALSDFEQGDEITVPMQYKPSQVGLPAYLDAKAGDGHVLPVMNFDGYEFLGQNLPAQTHYRVGSARANLTHVRGKHTLRAGLDARAQFCTGFSDVNTSGNFNFTNQYTRRNDDGFVPAGTLGHTWAAFMLGVPGNMTVGTSDSYAMYNPYYAGYFQEQWRVTPKLSVNLGFRMEYEMGGTERYDRIVGHFDAQAKLPIADPAQAAYAQRPVPELPASQFIIQGGAVYPGAGGRTRKFYDNQLSWMPRLGIAYQVNSKTVLRAGYGLYFDTINVNNTNPGQAGFSRTTSAVSSNNFGLGWASGDPSKGVSPMADPFPVRADGTRFDEPYRSSLGAMSRAGQAWTFVAFDQRPARQQRWRIGAQRQLARSMAVEIAYVGSHTDRVSVNPTLTALPEAYWADGLTRNDTIASNLNSNVTNPFNLRNFASFEKSDPQLYQYLSSMSFFNGSTIRKHQLLRPFPQSGTLVQNKTPLGVTRTHGMEIVFDRRFSRGFNLHANYTRLSDRGATVFLNEFDAQPSWRSANSGRPHRFAASTIWRMPFGKGKKFASRGFSSLLLGGWQMAVIYEWQPGPLIDFPNLFFNGDMDQIAGGERTLDRWFNIDAGFERTAAKGPAAYHRRVFPLRIEGLRADGLNRWDANLQRDFRLTERVTLQVRVDVMNVMNHTQFAAPAVDPYSTNFGRITATTINTMRMPQLQARIRF